jgi:hypothetical protein
MFSISSSNIISTILRHDAKTTSYKIALLRSINDVVLSFPGLGLSDKPVLVPLRILAEFWVAYYWPFVNPNRPIWQGPRNLRRQGVVNDIAFRPQLAELWRAWETFWGLSSCPSDGYVVMSEMRVPRKRVQYTVDFRKAYDRAIAAITRTIELKPVRYAGPGEWTVFERPVRYRPSASRGTPIPGTRAGDKCLVIRAEIWDLFRDLSLWIEALCIHEWALFVEHVEQIGPKPADRGAVYRLLTDRPDNRRPLTWERNQIDILVMEGHGFVCPWTQRHIGPDTAYDIDHLVPVSIYPINEIWNLVPSDRDFNQHRKRDRLPGAERLRIAEPILARTYGTYALAKPLAEALAEDVGLRFATVDLHSARFAGDVAGAAVAFIEQVAESRNWARF